LPGRGLRGDWLFVFWLLLGGGMFTAGAVYDLVTGHVRGGRAVGLLIFVFGLASMWAGWHVFRDRVSWPIVVLSAALVLAASPLDWWVYERPAQFGGRTYDWRSILIPVAALTWWITAIVWRLWVACRQSQRRAAEPPEMVNRR